MLEIIQTLLSNILHIDIFLNEMAAHYGAWLFVVLFLTIFAETGLVIFPFLPGDSFLFAVGALSAGSEHFPIQILIPLLCVASIAGDSTNYIIGRKYGRRLFETKHRFSKFLNPKHLHKTEDFFKTKGVLAVSISRFLPIFRTFTPFVAGITKMKYPLFLRYSILGSVLWISLFVGAGYFFGRIPFIQQNFTLFVMAIVGLSLAPVLLGILRNLAKKEL